jgi:hypothetical protein
MSDEQLTDVLDDKADYLAYKKAKTIEKLGERTHLTMAQIAKLVSHPEHGDVVSTITLGEVLEVAFKDLASDEEDTEEDTEEAPVPTAVKRSTAKKASRASSGRKKAAAKKVAKKASGRKSDFGKKKPRLDRDQGYREIKAALKAAQGPCGRSDLEEATGYSAVQVRTFCKELASKGEINILGKGGRSTQYELA